MSDQMTTAVIQNIISCIRSAANCSISLIGKTSSGIGSNPIWSIVGRKKQNIGEREKDYQTIGVVNGSKVILSKPLWGESSANRFRSDIMNHARSSTIYKLVPVEEKKVKENR